MKEFKLLYKTIKYVSIALGLILLVIAVLFGFRG